MKLNYKIWFTNADNEGVLGDGKWQILKAIEETGSLTGACEKLGITYRRTWNDLKNIEKKLGFPLLEKSRGGAEGGSSKLTSEGLKLVKAFDSFHERVDKLMHENFQLIIKDITQ
jgi:molybdate transport system regulatory protein